MILFMLKNEKKIGVIYEITGNPYFDNLSTDFSNKISEYVYPSEINDICSSLEELGYDYELIDGPNGFIEDIQKKNHCEIYFNKSIGFNGLERKIVVPAIAKLHKIPLIGTSAYAMTLARHKYHTNRLLYGMGFNVPFAYLIYNLDNIPDIPSFPVILKPNHESDALGINENSICFNLKQLKQRAEQIFHIFKQPIIIEEFISGEEWKVAVIGNGNTISACGVVNTLKNGISMNDTLQTRDDILSNNLSYSYAKSKLLNEAEKLSINIHKLLGLYDYSRCDFRLSADGQKIYCMEVSTHPFISNSEACSFTYSAKKTLHTYTNTIDQIIKAALKRMPN